ncbi:hypothetical protein GCM10023163_16480 [Aestuariibaculum suncheonense]
MVFSGGIYAFLRHNNPISHDDSKEETLQSFWSERHRSSNWYTGLESNQPNFYQIRNQFTNYFSSNPYFKTPEVKKFKKFVQKHFPNIDAQGNYIKPLAKQEDASNFSNKLKAKGNSWNHLFLKWNTFQDNGGVGVLRSIRIDPKNVNHVLAGAVTAGIWRTNDSGNNWTFVSGGVPEVESVNEIIYSRHNPKIVYANTNMGVIKSIDGGNNWNYTSLRKTFPESFKSLQWLDLPNTSSNVVYATTEENRTYTLYNSVDGGQSWEVVYSTPKRIWDMRVKPDDKNVVYIIEESETTDWINFKKSIDGGKTFKIINTGFPADYNLKAHRGRLATTPANSDVIYLAIGFNGGGKNDKISFFKSSDAGESFDKACCGDKTEPLVNAMDATSFLNETCHLSQLTWNFAFTVSETDENYLVCAANKLKVSTDGGATWHYDLSGDIVTGKAYDQYNSNNAHTGIHGDHHGLSVIGKHIWNGNDGGAYHSSDGGYTVVKDKTNGLGIQELWGFSQSFKNDIMAVGLNHNRICFRDDQVYGGWIAVNGADAMAANVNPIDDQYLYTHPWGHQKVKRSLISKNGHEFKDLGIELGYLTLDNLEFHPHYYYTIYGSDYGDRNKTYHLAKSTDNAESWEVIKDMSNEKANALSVKVSFADANYVYAVIEPNKVIKSIDEGKTWISINPPAELLRNYALWRLAVSDKDPNHLWVSVKGSQDIVKVIESKDGGLTWNDYSKGLPQYAIYSMVYQRGSDDILYVGTRLGVYYRKAGMDQWVPFGTGMPAANTSFMFINYAKGKLRVGTSRGLWENDLVELTAPKANISVDRSEVTLDDSHVKFADFSVADKDATYFWEFKGGTPATSTEERPVVSYKKVSKKGYDVTLTVTDSRGSSTQKLKNFIKVKKK